MIVLVEGIGYFSPTGGAGNTLQAWFTDGAWSGSPPASSIIIPTLSIRGNVTESLDLVGGVSPPSTLETEIAEKVDPAGDPGGTYVLARMMGNLGSSLLMGGVPNTPITATVTRAAVTINVGSTTGFAAGPAWAWIGLECFKYTDLTATSFTGCTRGEFSPVIGGAAFPHYHELRSDEFATTPVVTQWPQMWLGRKVVIYALHVQADGTWADPTTNAYRVWTGRIVARNWNGKVWRLALRSILGDLDRMIFSRPKPVDRPRTVGFHMPTRGVATGALLPEVSHKTSTGATYTTVQLDTSVIGGRLWYVDGADFAQAWGASVPTNGVYLSAGETSWRFSAGGGTGVSCSYDQSVRNVIGEPSVNVENEDYLLEPAPTGRFQFRFDAETQPNIRLQSIPTSMSTSAEWQSDWPAVGLWIAFVDTANESNWIVLPIATVTVAPTPPDAPKLAISSPILPVATRYAPPGIPEDWTFVTEGPDAFADVIFVPNWGLAYDPLAYDPWAAPVLRILASYTGTTGGYDVHSYGWGIAMDVNDIDTASFEAVEAEFPLEALQRRHIFNKPISARDLLDAEGRTLGVGFTMVGGLLSAVILPRYDNRSDTVVTTLDRSNMSEANERVSIQESFDTHYSIIAVKHGYDFATDEFRGSEIQIVDTQNIGMSGRGKVLEIANKGIVNPRPIAHIALERLGLYRLPWPALARSFNRTLTGVMRPGDVIALKDELTPDLINRDFGITGEGARCIVESVTISLPDFERNKVQLRMIPGGILFPYVPAGLISAINSPTNTIITLTATPQFGSDEISFFAANDKVMVAERDAQNPAAPATGPWRRTVSSVNVPARTITLDSALAGFDITAHEYFVTFDLYDTATAGQRDLGSWIADGGTIQTSGTWRIYG